MSSISNNIKAFGNAVNAGLAQAGNAVANKAKNAANAAVGGVKVAGNFLIDPQAQQRAEAAFRNGVNFLYTNVSKGLNKAVEVMEREQAPKAGILGFGKAPKAIKGGVEVLRTPIAPMKNLKIARFHVDSNVAGGNQGLKKAANALINFHEKVVQGGERVSREMGNKTHALTRAALEPIRFLAKLLKMEVVGALIQNSVALALAFAVRGVVLGLSQLGHLVPYVVTAAAVAGTVLGIAAIAVKVSPLVAAIVAFGLIIASQQIQINSLGNRLDNLTNAVRKPIVPVTPIVKRAGQAVVNGAKATAQGAKTAGAAIVKHKGKVAAVSTAAAAAGLASVYGVGNVAPYAQKAVKFVAPYATTALNAVKDAAAHAAVLTLIA